jgi:hypothetical protein
LTPAPYAISAHTASNLLGALPAGQISGTIPNAALPASPSFSGTVTANNFSGNSEGLTNGNASTFFSSGTVPDARLPQASFSNSGVLPATSDYGRLRVAGLRARIHRVPPLGMDTWYLTGVSHDENTIKTYVDIAYERFGGLQPISITEGWRQNQRGSCPTAQSIRTSNLIQYVTSVQRPYLHRATRAHQRQFARQSSATFRE